MTNLSIRSLVALGGIPLFLMAGYAGGTVFMLLVLAVSLLGLLEFYRMAAKDSSPNIPVGMLFGMCVTLLFSHNRLQLQAAAMLESVGWVPHLPSLAQSFLILVLLFLPLLLIAELFRGVASPLRSIGSTLAGVFYVSLFFGSLIGLREIFVVEEFPVTEHFGLQGLSVPDQIAAQIDHWGGLTMCTVFAAIWVCDSAAYFAGRSLGRRKLWVRVSPNKTWEGAVAGFIGAVGAFLLARELLLPYLSFAEAATSGMIIGVFGQLGDLVESMIKREAGLKDSSVLIPGHGGILDRFDSMLVSAPVLFLYYDFIVMAR